MDLSGIDESKFLALLEELSPHSVYRPAFIVGQLSACGIPARVDGDGNGIFLSSIHIPSAKPEWGEPGISSLSILAVVFQLTVGRRPHSEMIGRGFWYRDVAAALRREWEIAGHHVVSPEVFPNSGGRTTEEVDPLTSQGWRRVRDSQVSGAGAVAVSVAIARAVALDRRMGKFGHSDHPRDVRVVFPAGAEGSRSISPEFRGEIMWVTIIAAWDREETWVGELMNEPRAVPYKRGDQIVFECREDALYCLGKSPAGRSAGRSARYHSHVADSTGDLWTGLPLRPEATPRIAPAAKSPTGASVSENAPSWVVRRSTPWSARPRLRRPWYEAQCFYRRGRSQAAGRFSLCSVVVSHCVSQMPH